MTRYILLLLTCLIGCLTTSSAQEIAAPEPATRPAVAEKQFTKLVLVRTALVHPALTGDGSEIGYGQLTARVTQGALVSVAEGYEVAPDGQTQQVILDVKLTAVRSSVFRAAFKAYRDAVVRLALEAYYTEKIDAARAKDPEADVSAWTSARSTVRAALNIAE